MRRKHNSHCFIEVDGYDFEGKRLVNDLNSDKRICNIRRFWIKTKALRVLEVCPKGSVMFHMVLKKKKWHEKSRYYSTGKGFNKNIILRG